MQRAHLSKNCTLQRAHLSKNCTLQRAFSPKARHHTTSNPAFPVSTSEEGAGYFSIMEVSGWRFPFISRRNALAEPKFRYKSRRTGKWFLSSVT